MRNYDCRSHNSIKDENKGTQRTPDNNPTIPVSNDRPSGSSLSAFHFDFVKQEKDHSTPPLLPRVTSRSDLEHPNLVAFAFPLGPPETPEETNFGYSPPRGPSIASYISQLRDSTPPSTPNLSPRSLSQADLSFPTIATPDSSKTHYHSYGSGSYDCEAFAKLFEEVPELSEQRSLLDTQPCTHCGIPQILITGATDIDSHQETIMATLRPESAMAMSSHRREAIRLAKTQEKAVAEKCKRSGDSIPGYTFDELIGKGSFGRVYKGRQTSGNRIVAIKVLDIDEADYRAFLPAKDEQLKDFHKEIRILQQAKESGAPNLNLMIEALSVHSQLWVVCEYCPGGSVKTLMRATNDRLGEKYIIIVARELARALEGLHKAGIMHRDVKAANVLVHEEGRLQLCDFGVATVLEAKTDKRKTFIGTPHWMPPELFDRDPEYSDEVDVWEYGITLYECAVGKPPNADLREVQQIRSRMRRLKEGIDLPKHEAFSPGLRSLVQYALDPDAKTRPSMKQILEHECLVNTEDSHPTSSLKNLVSEYYSWLYSGGQRMSLFMPGGAAAASDAPGAITTPDDEWNFSTTDGFEKRISAILDIPDFSSLVQTEGDLTPKAFRDKSVTTDEMTPMQKANFEARVIRGADLANVFDGAKPYTYEAKTDFVPIEQRRVSDLPLRTMNDERPSSIASNVIDLGDFNQNDYAEIRSAKEDTIRLADAATIRAKRGDSKHRDSSSTDGAGIAQNATVDNIPNLVPRPETKDFSFPPKEWQNVPQVEVTSEPLDDYEYNKPIQSARKTMDWTFPGFSADPEPEADTRKENVDPSLTAKPAFNEARNTMQWSFTDAMNAVEVTPEKPPPSRPPFLRTATMPVTRHEVGDAEMHRPDHDASLEFSSVSDQDPFGLDDDAVEDFIIQDLDDREAGAFYATAGTLIGAAQIPPLSPPVDSEIPDFEYATPPQAALGDPGSAVRSDSIDRSIPSSGALQHTAIGGHRMTKQNSSSMSDSSITGSGSGPGSSFSGKLAVSLPDIVPPSMAAMDARATSDELEAEFARLLGDWSSVLGAAGEAVTLVAERSGYAGRGRTRVRDGLDGSGHVERGLGLDQATENGAGGHVDASDSEWVDDDGDNDK